MTQKSREAILDLLFLALYIDNHLSLAEDTALESAIRELGWDSTRPREIFLLNAFARARETIKSLEQIQAVMADRAAVIRADNQGTTALELLARVLASDGLTSGEQHMLKEFHRLLD
jgi:hypothetical protein